MKKEKVVHFNVKKVVSHDGKGMPIIEDNVIKISPEFQVIRYINLISQQNNLSIDVVKVSERNGDNSEFVEIDEIEKWQSLVNEQLKPQSKVKDYKKAYEDQSKDIENLKAQMAELLASKNNVKSNKEILQNKCDELGIDYNGRLGEVKLLEKIQEVEPEYNLN